jgi:hypothetical protein
VITLGWRKVRPGSLKRTQRRKERKNVTVHKEPTLNVKTYRLKVKGWRKIPYAAVIKRKQRNLY